MAPKTHRNVGILLALCSHSRSPSTRGANLSSNGHAGPKGGEGLGAPRNTSKMQCKMLFASKLLVCLANIYITLKHVIYNCRVSHAYKSRSWVAVSTYFNPMLTVSDG